MALVLIYTQTGEPVKVGDTVVTGDNESAVVQGWQEPQHPGSSGRVIVKEKGRTMLGRYFPHVYDLHFAELLPATKTGAAMNETKAIYWTEVETYTPGPAVGLAKLGLQVWAFSVTVNAQSDARYERRRAAIAARGKARKLSGNPATKTHLLSAEKTTRHDADVRAESRAAL